MEYAKTKIVCAPESRLHCGLGHLVRQSALTNSLNSHGFDARLVIPDEILESRLYAPWAKKLTSLSSTLRRADAQSLIADPKMNTALIIDSYNYVHTAATVGYRAVRDNLIVVDDLAYQRDYPSHIVTVIPNICSRRQKKAITKAYHADGATRLHGPEYILLNPQFDPERSKRVAILNERQRRLNACSMGRRPLVVLIGFGGSPCAKLDDFTREYFGKTFQSMRETFSRVEVLCLGAVALDLCAAIGQPARNLGLLDTWQLKQTYLEADVYIGSVGYSMWERALLLLPSFVMPIADNQNPYVETGEELGIHRRLISSERQDWLGRSHEMLATAFGIQTDYSGYFSLLDNYVT
jgi:spore coat polysaccharide biosynthesis predicted glycosyltransferase SpsG